MLPNDSTPVRLQDIMDEHPHVVLPDASFALQVVRQRLARGLRPMFKNLKVRNYRVFKDLRIDGLRRINLIAGRNNAGKTALLEALTLLASGHSGATVNPLVMRDLPQPNMSPNAIPGVFWKPMFAMLDDSQPIEFQADHTKLGCLRLHLEVRAADAKITADVTGGGVPIDGSAPVLKGTLLRGDEERESALYITDKGVRVEHDKPVTIPVGFMPSGGAGDATQDAAVLGDLKKQKRDRLVVEALQTIAPDLTRLEIITATGAPIIWGDIGLAEMISLPSLGEGMVRFARLALLMLAGGEVILLDEVENGIHHSILPQLWKFIERTARRFDLQVFATTHSFECVQAAYRTLDADQFRLHRLEVDEDGSNRCVTYEPDAIDAAIRHHLEVR